MAIYTTLFLCRPDDLPSGFPGWRLPLPTPVRREFNHPVTGEPLTIETRAPEWPDEEDIVDAEYQVIAMHGDYKEYLENRLPPSVQTWPHWATKGITDIEVGLLAEALAVEPSFDPPLYGPPSAGANLEQFPPVMLFKLASLQPGELEGVGEKWAQKMSAPDYTHSVSGNRISDGWSLDDAMRVLKPIVTLAKKAKEGEQMYLLMEY